MGLRINTNIASLNAQQNLDKVSERLSSNFQHLSSGLRITRAADDAAGLALSEKLRSKILSYGQAGRNTQDGISLVQVADAAIGEQSNLLNRVRELAVQAASGTLGTAERTTINNEVQALITEINRIATTTEFNGVQLLDGTVATAAIQVGVNAGQTITITNSDSTTATLAINTLSTTSVANATAAITAIDAAIVTVNNARGTYGASQNRLLSAFNSVQSARENLSAAESRIRDVDFASETADLTRNTILQQAATSVLQQANLQPQIALALLRGAG